MSVFVISLGDLDVPAEIERLVHRRGATLTVPRDGMAFVGELFDQAVSSMVATHAWRIGDVGGDLSQVHDYDGAYR